MKKTIIILTFIVAIMFSLIGCRKETLSDVEGERRLSDEQALSAIKNYCYEKNADLEEIVNTGEQQVYWNVSSSTDAEIVVEFRSYTGALIRYYIDRVSGETYSTEFISGITSEEQRTDESLNVWEYTDAQSK